MFSQLKKMSYDEILKQTQRLNKEKTQPVFSEIIGQTIEMGKLAEFIKETETNLNTELVEPTVKDSYLKNRLSDMLAELQIQTDRQKRWLTLIGLLERKIIQVRLYRHIQVSYSTQIQKSGQNKFNYILLRAPFMDVYTGKKEVRIYFKKLEDFPNFTSIDELKEDKHFKSSAIESIRQEMMNIMENDGVDINYIRDELNKISIENENSRLKKIVDLTSINQQLRKELKICRESK